MNSVPGIARGLVCLYLSIFTITLYSSYETKRSASSRVALNQGLLQAGRQRNCGQGVSQGAPIGNSTNDFALTITIISNAKSKRRFRSFKRLLSSLRKADYSSLRSTDAIDLSFRFDSLTSDEVYQYALNYKWKWGSKSVHRRVIKGGLIAAVVEAWQPTNDNEVGLLLEDDIEVSPMYFKYLQTSFQHTNPSVDPRILGVSLYTPRRIEVVNPKFNFDPSQLMEAITGDPTMPYLQQLPCSWGAAFYAPHWKEFSNYMRERLSVDDLDKPQLNAVHQSSSLTSGWQSSWKKYMIEIMYLKGWFMLYPSFPNQTALSTNHLEIGEHILTGDKSHLAEDFTIPLMSADDYRRLSKLKRKKYGSKAGIFDIEELDRVPRLDLTSLPFTTLDYLSALMPSSDASKKLPEVRYHYNERKTGRLVTTVVRGDDPPSFASNLYKPLQQSRVCKEFSRTTNMIANDEERVTLLLSTYDRYDILRLQLEYYTRSDLIATVLVTWQHRDVAAPPPMLVNGKIVQFLPQAEDSLNNRMFPHMRILTTAVLVMDDDIKIHLDDIEQLFGAWKRNQGNLVGFFPRKVTKEKGGPAYDTQSIERNSDPYHLMLTKSMMFDKRFLEAYSCESAVDPARAFVDEYMNCEDIAMNFVVWNRTRQAAPLFVEPLHHIGDFGTIDKHLPVAQSPIHTRIARVKRLGGKAVSHIYIRTTCVRRFMAVFGTGDNGLPEQKLKVQHTILDSRKVKLMVAEMNENSTQYKHSNGFITNCAYDSHSPYPWAPNLPNVMEHVSTRLSSPDEACRF